MANYQRLSVNINDECAETLRTITAARGITTTEAVRRAVGLLGFAEDARRAGSQLIVKDRQGRTSRVEML
jgi:hypothetical protein